MVNRMRNIESELHEYICDYCKKNNISIDLRFACFGDINRFFTNNTKFSLNCIDYYTQDFEDIKQFLVYYVDTMWGNCRYPYNRIALYIKDIVDMGSWYSVVVGGGLFTDEALA